MPNVDAVPERRAKRILVVDDDRAVREMLVRVLIGDGYLALPAADGPEALKSAATIRFDLVLLDLGMPGWDGWKTFENLARQHPGLAVIIITAKPDQRAIADAAGVRALFEKPLDFPELLQTVGQLLAEPPKLQENP